MADGVVGAGRVGQERAGQGRSSSELERTYDLAMNGSLKCVAFGAGMWDKIRNSFRHIATILELCTNFV